MSTGLTLKGLIRNCGDGTTLKNWYTKYLGFTCESEQQFQGDWISVLFPGSHAASLHSFGLRLGQEVLQLWFWPGVNMHPYPADTQGIDHWFQHLCLVSDALQAVYGGSIQKASTPISLAPQSLPVWNPGAAGIQAVKFVDPQGHPLELLQFPADKGDSRWHLSKDLTGKPKGIDHSAISIASTEDSLAFYTQLLGMDKVGSGINYGSEQDAMDGLVDARVAITALKAQPGHMGVEFLDYQQPDGGRTRSDPRWTDQVDDKLLIYSPNIRELHVRVHQSPWSAQCSPLVSLPHRFLGADLGFALRDPDQHALVLVGDDH